MPFNIQLSIKLFYKQLKSLLICQEFCKFVFGRECGRFCITLFTSAVYIVCSTDSSIVAYGLNCILCMLKFYVFILVECVCVGIDSIKGLFLSKQLRGNRFGINTSGCILQCVKLLVSLYHQEV